MKRILEQAICLYALDCCTREGEELDWEDIEGAAECLIHGIPYAGIGQ